jgi:hypothetical protein
VAFSAGGEAVIGRSLREILADLCAASREPTPTPPHPARRARRIRRELIRARTGGGRKRIKERGVRFGRPLKLNAYQRWEALARREAGETLMDIARSCGISHPTIMRL